MVVGRGTAMGAGRRMGCVLVGLLLGLAAAPATTPRPGARFQRVLSDTQQPPTQTAALPPLPRPATIAALVEELLAFPFAPPEPPAPAEPGQTEDPFDPFDPFEPFPSPGGTAGPPAATAPVPDASGVVASTVKVTGVACGLRLNGSGFSPERDTILTNAHVVAGVDEPTVVRPDGKALRARAVVFDAMRDVAVLVVPGLDEPSLPLGSAAPPQSATVYGHPRGQDAVQELPVRVQARSVDQVPNIYNTGAALQENLVLAGAVQQGVSGAPTVDTAGAVVGMVFAVDTLRPDRAYAIPGEDLADSLAAPRATEVDTGPCLR